MGTPHCGSLACTQCVLAVIQEGLTAHRAALSPPPCPPLLRHHLCPAVNILGASNIRFTNCNFGVNYADNMGGAVKTVGSNVTFSTTAFYQNRVRML